MKKIVVIVSIVLVVSGIGAAIVYKLQGPKKLPIEKILPEQAMFYLQMSEIEKSLEEFKTTQLWWNIQQIDLELLLQKSGLTEQDLAQFNEFQAKYIRFLPGLLWEFFGQEVACAIYPFEISSFEDPRALLEAASSFVLVTRLRPEAEFIELLTKVFDKFDRQVQIRDKKYKDYEVNLVALTDQLDLVFASVEDLLVIGLGEPAVFACLDVASGDQPALTHDKQYILTRSRLSQDAQTIGYGNLELLFSNVKQVLSSIPATQEEDITKKAQALKQFEKSTGLETIGLSSSLEKVAQTKAVVLFDKAKMDPDLAVLYSFKPQKNNSISFVPKDVIYYQWSNCLDAELSWDNFQQQLAEQRQHLPPGAPQFSNIFSGIEQELGQDIENDIIPAMGNETGGFLADINMDGPFPIPEILFFLKVKDQAVFETALDTLTAKNTLPMRSEMYKDINIKYVSLPFGKGFQPGYCFLDDYLLIACSQKLLKQSIDASSNQSLCLTANQDFQAVDFGLTKENNGIFFFKTATFFSKIRQICDWGVDWASLMKTNLVAAQRMAEQQLESYKGAIQAQEQELRWQEASLEALKEKVKELESGGQDSSHQQQEVSILQAKLDNRKEEIALARKDLEAKQQEFSVNLVESPVQTMDLELIKLYLDEAIYPILDGLSSYKATGMRTRFERDMVTSESFQKMEE
ncbi:MAG: DUF3352 domain-containing protein [Candidatus Omnitrophica bacterium]|nr:DUF3352 domain-containing protein [Candidatus Omnitrophota bacterium]